MATTGRRNFLSLPCKRAWDVDMTKPLKAFISSTFTNVNVDECGVSIAEFQKLRSSMISKSADRHESSLEVLYRYYDQLVAIENKLPIAENAIRINFKWQDAFDKESFFSGKRTLTVASGAYEKVCVLYNIAALQSAVASSQGLDSDEGIKGAAKLYQQSSGILNYLKDCVLSHVQHDPTPDLHPDTLGALAVLMLAQAQDCFCQKAFADRMKPLITAKLVHQCSDYYADAMKLLQLQSIRDLWSKEWLATVIGKQASYHALAEYFQSLVHKDQKEFGEQIARLKHAKDLMAAAEVRGGATFAFQDYQKKILAEIAEAVKDNDFIYHARVPEINSLPSIGKAPLAKPTPMASPMSSKFSDLFEKVMPLPVHQAMINFDGRKTEILNIEIGRLREKTQLLNGVLASMNLPAALEDLSGSKVPQSVLEKAERVRSMGGIQNLNKLINDLPQLLLRNREILNESIKLLDEEEASDNQLRTQFSSRWTRTPSSKLTEPIREEGKKYKNILDNATSADQVVQQKYASTKQGIELLSKSDSEISKSLPTGGTSGAAANSPVVSELRNLVELAETMKAEREVIENELKNASSDMANKFMTALAQDGAINEENLTQRELDRMFESLRAQVKDSSDRQESLLVNLERVNNNFVASRGQSGSGASRDECLKSLAVAFDSFSELRNNLEEGTKFYNDLTQLLVKYQTKVQDLCFARKTEKDELMKDVSQSIANNSAKAAPPAPAYQQPTDEEGPKKEPPPRPPPPTRPPQPETGSLSSVASAPNPSPVPPMPYGMPQPAIPYPAFTGYVAPPMPQGYNPYANYNYGQQPPPPQGAYPAQQYYQPYPAQPQWRQ